MKRTAVIMAGGSGERFWPMSRKHKPKQLLQLTSPDKTMIEEAIDRIMPLIPYNDIFIVTSELLQSALRKALPYIPAENIIAEPLKRNTAPCIALAAAFIAERYGAKGYSTADISMAVLAADHHIKEQDIFLQTVDAALSIAELVPRLVTIGIPPDRPETGYGYIEVEQQESTPLEGEDVLSFREKPDRDLAGEFVASGRFLWNSGMFFWRLDTVMEGLEYHLPEVGQHISALRSVLHDATDTAYEGAPPHTGVIFEQMPDISIDYGLMERAANVSVVRAPFSWDDVGSWDAMPRVHPSDNQGNIAVGEVAIIDSKDCIIVNSTPNQSLAVAAIGLEGIVIVATPDGILVCPKDRVQEVRKVVQTLREKHGDKFV